MSFGMRDSICVKILGIKIAVHLEIHNPLRRLVPVSWMAAISVLTGAKLNNNVV